MEAPGLSDHYLRLIPTDPTYVPTVAAQEEAVSAVRGLLPRAETVRCIVTEEVRFVDPGANFEGVSCPTCGSDVLDWWKGAMDRAFESRFSDLSVTPPCCGTATSLNDLRYSGPAGFGQYALEAANPGGNLPQAALAAVGQILGCQIREIRAHY